MGYNSGELIRTKHNILTMPPWDLEYYHKMWDAMAELANYALTLEGNYTNKKKLALDLGCGQGDLMSSLSRVGFQAIGVDFEWRCALDSKKRGIVVLGDIMMADSFIRPESFDVVLSSHVLEHIENPKAAVQIMKKISRRWLVIAVPNLTRLVNWFLRKPRYINPGHLHGWDAHHLKTFLEVNCGLKIVRWKQDVVLLTYLRRSFIRKARPFRFLEESLLPFIIPQGANSLIVLCEKV